MDPLEVLWLLFQIVGEIVFDVVGELIFRGFGDLVDCMDRPSREALWAALFYLAAGAALGLLSAFVLPGRLLPPPRTAGLSLVLSPLFSGIALHAWGAYRRDRGHATSRLATFYGGAAFALGAALGRFALVA